MTNIEHRLASIEYRMLTGSGAMNRRLLPLITGITVTLLADCGGQVPAPAAAPAAIPRSPGTLYHRVGGYDALAALVDDFLGRMLADPGIAPFFRDLQTSGQQQG